MRRNPFCFASQVLAVTARRSSLREEEMGMIEVMFSGS